jgi:hypothetical protein
MLEDNTVIDWNKVAKEYSGIFIKNATLKKARSDFIWYSMFDICSVAIWNKEGIKNILPMHEEFETR